MEIRPMSPDDRRRIDALLTHLARRVSRGDEARPGGGKATPSALWTRGVAVATLGPGPEAAALLASHREDLAALGVVCSPPDHATPWLALDVSLGRWGEEVVDSVKLAAFDLFLRLTLSGSGRAGYHLEAGRGILLGSGPFGRPVDAAMAGASGIEAGVAARSAAVGARLVGVTLGPQDKDGIHRHRLREDARGWWPALKAGLAEVGRGLAPSLGGGGGELWARAGGAWQERSASAGALAQAAHRGARGVDGLQLTLGVQQLAPQEELELAYRSPADAYLYLVLQSGADLSLPLQAEPLRAPGEPVEGEIVLTLDDTPCIERPLLLLAHRPLPELGALVDAVNVAVGGDAELRVGAFRGALSQALGPQMTLMEAGRFAHGMVPEDRLKGQIAAAREALERDDPEAALGSLERALAQPQGEAERSRILSLRARALRRQGDREGAMECLGEARSLAQRGEAWGALGDAEREIGRIWVELGHSAAGIAHLVRARSLHASVCDAAGEADDLLQLGVALRRGERIAEAIQALRGAIALGSAGDLPRIEGAAWASLAQVDQDLGHLTRAKAHLERAQEAMSRAGSPAGEMRVATDLGALNLALGEAAPAEDAFRRARALAQALGSAPGEALGELNVGVALGALGRHGDALLPLSRALEAAALPSAAHRAGAQMALGRSLLACGRVEEAGAALVGLSPGDASLPPDLRWQIAEGLGQWRSRAGLPGVAEAYGAGVTALEDARAKLPPGLRTRYLEQSQRIFNGWIDHLFREGAPAEAVVNAIERSRARAFFDALVAAEARAPEGDGRGAGDLARFLPEYTPDPVGALLASLPSDLTLLGFHVLPERLLAFSLGRGRVEVRALPLPRGEVRRLAQAAMAGVQSPHAPGAGAARARAWAALSTQLLGPLTDWLLRLEPEARLAILPHGPLYGVPLHGMPLPLGLPKQGEPLVAAYRPFYLPSLSAALRWSARGRPSREGALILANPGGDLVHAEAEACIVAQLLGEASVHVGAEASMETVRSLGPKAGVIHLATHGQRGQDGLDARLLLGTPGGGGVSPQALAVLPLAGVGLVTLSACESAAGALSPAGEGADLLSWSLLMAGARAVVASGWRVNDGATKALMGRFYLGMAGGMDPLTALTHAQRAFLRSDGAVAVGGERAAVAARRRRAPTLSADPYHWAAFSLTGDWR